MKKALLITAVTISFFLGKPVVSRAQLSLTGQLRTRTELRDGYGNLNTKGAAAALEAGASIMAATNSMEYVKKGTIDKAGHTPGWFYLMINIRPDFMFK